MKASDKKRYKNSKACDVIKNVIYSVGDKYNAPVYECLKQIPIPLNDHPLTVKKNIEALLSSS